MVLSSSCINIKCVVTDFIRHYLKLAFCEEKCRKSWPNLIPIRENGKIVEEHKGFLSGKWLGRHIRGGLFFPWPPKVEGYGWLPNMPPLSREGTRRWGDTPGAAPRPTGASLMKRCHPQLRLWPRPYSYRRTAKWWPHIRPLSGLVPWTKFKVLYIYFHHRFF